MRHSLVRTLFSAGAFALALTAAAPSPDAAAQELKIAVAADITSMDPHFFNLFPNNNMAEHIFDKLVQMDADSKMIPGLATSWKVIDPTTWEFKLRKGVKFHDGSELTAEDVAFSIDRVPNVPNSPGPFSRTPRRSSRKEIVDPYTIRFKYAAPYPLAPERPVDDLHRVEEGRDRRDDRGLQHAARPRSAAAATSSSSTRPAITSTSCATTTTGATSRRGTRSRSRSSRTSPRASPRCCPATSTRSSSRRPPTSRGSRAIPSSR